ncbi:hypothetical protein [Pseudoclavibacter helvolus]|uniref:hypothetical protein n=1 Tax=Pseudoclavibacter helvolus TaxID=255205 RepID=UPI003C79461C
MKPERMDRMSLITVLISIIFEIRRHISGGCELCDWRGKWRIWEPTCIWDEGWHDMKAHPLNGRVERSKRR